MRWVVEREVPQDNKDGNESGNMDDYDEDLELGEQIWDDHIDEDGNGNNQPSEERSLPLLRVVVGIVKNDQTLNDDACENRLSCHCRYPSQGRQPSNDIAREHLVASGREHVYPIVLASRNWRHRRQFRDDCVYGESRAPGNYKAIDQACGAAVIKALAEEGENGFPRDQLAHSKAKQRPEAETPFQNLFLSEEGQYIVIRVLRGGPRRTYASHGVAAWRWLRRGWSGQDGQSRDLTSREGPVPRREQSTDGGTVQFANQPIVTSSQIAFTRSAFREHRGLSGRKRR